MAWNDLSIPQRSQLMNMFRRNGVSSLSEMKRLYDLASSSTPLAETTTMKYNPIAPVYANGGRVPPQVDENDFVGPELPKELFNGPEVPYGFYDAPIDWKRKKALQHYAESSFLPNQVSRAGAAGPYQIMPRIWNHYKDKLGLTGSPQDYNNSEAVRDTMMEGLLNAGWVNKNFPSDSVRAAKAFMGYNWGSGNATNFLEDMKRQGVDIYHSMDWVDMIPNDETRNYVNYILRERDIPGGKTIAGFEKALPHRFDAFPEAQHANGGNLFWPGGGLNPIPFSSMLYNLKSILPTKILKKTASRIHNLQHGSESLYPKRRLDGDPGDTFLLDAKRQKEELEKLGYTEGAEGDYGLVKGAVNNLISDTHKAKVPVYQLGVDDAARDTLQVIYNGMYPNDNIPEEGQLIHAGSYPFAIYKGNNSNTYFVKSWDLNDYGKHGDSGGTTYGSRQFLADLYDKVGSPFVQTSGFKQIKDWDGKVVSEDDLDISKETFENIPYIKKYIEGIESFRADYGDAWADQAIENLYTNYVNELKTTGVIPVEYREFKSGGKIHIKPENRGKFTALLKRTGKSASWFKAHGTPLQRKRATFALNARKWKHAHGGIIF